MMTENSLQSEDSKNKQFPEVKEKEENCEQQDDLQSSTAASNLNKSIDNLSLKNMISNLDITEEIQALSKRKLSAPISFSQTMRFNIERLGKGPKRAYFDKLLSKGFFN